MLRTATGAQPRSSWMWLLLALAVALGVHAPSLHLGFVSDDFDWWSMGRRAVERPALLMSALDTFFRPANTWSFSLDYLLFGTNPVGYHATNLILHLLAGALLWWLLARFSFAPTGRGAAVAVWLCSPLTLEPAQSLAIRFELILFVSWLGMALVWPSPGEAWTRRKLLTATLLTAVAACAKESWVVLPAFTLCFDLFLACTSLRIALRRATLIGLAPLVYVLLYFLLFPGDKGGYYAGGLAAAGKVPHALAAFFRFTAVQPRNFPFGLPEAVALAVAGFLVWSGWRRRSRAMGLGFAFLILPFLPVLSVGFMTSRYTTIPFAGFVIVICAALSELDRSLQGLWRRASRALTVALIASALIVEVVGMRAEMIDAGRCSVVYARALDEARAFATRLPRDRPLLVLRLDQDSPLIKLAAMGSVGILKIYYQRPEAPYGLAAWAPLFSMALDDQGGPILVEAPLDRWKGSSYAVIGHAEGRFGFVAAEAHSLEDEVKIWNDRHVAWRLLVPWPEQRRR